MVRAMQSIDESTSTEWTTDSTMRRTDKTLVTTTASSHSELPLNQSGSLSNEEQEELTDFFSNSSPLVVGASAEGTMNELENSGRWNNGLLEQESAWNNESPWNESRSSNASTSSSLTEWLRSGPTLNYWVRQADHGERSQGYCLTIQSARHLSLSQVDRQCQKGALC